MQPVLQQNGLTEFSPFLPWDKRNTQGEKQFLPFVQYSPFQKQTIRPSEAFLWASLKDDLVILRESDSIRDREIILILHSAAGRILTQAPELPFVHLWLRVGFHWMGTGDMQLAALQSCCKSKGTACGRLGHAAVCSDTKRLDIPTTSWQTTHPWSAWSWLGNRQLI